jgi:hypothetical protein
MYSRYLEWRSAENINAVLDDPPLSPKAEALLDVRRPRWGRTAHMQSDM